MAINPQKLLPPPKETSIVKFSSGIVKAGSSVVISKKSQSNIQLIKVKSIEVNKLLKGTLALDKKKLDDKKRKDNQKEKQEQEEKLESKPQIKRGKIEFPKLPRMGFLDFVKNFIGNVILGYFAVRLVDHLPKLIPFIKVIGRATDFIINLGGKLLDGLVTFIDWGYKGYDATRGFVKNLFGEDGVKKFDQLSGLLNQFLNLAIIAGMVAAGSGGLGKGKGGISKPGVGGRTKVTTSGGVRNPLRKRPTVTTGGGRSVGGLNIRNPLRQGPRVTVGGGNKSLLTSVRPFLKNIRIPVIAALVDFGLSVALGENPGRAAFKAIGAGLLGYIGAGLGGAIGLAGGPLAIATSTIGAIAGGTLGDLAGGALYDIFFGGKNIKPSTKKMAGGGITRGGKTPTGAKRTIGKTKKNKKYKRTLPQKPGEVEITSPGSDVGGEDKLFGLFPNPLKTAQRAFDMMNPFKVIENTGKNLGESDYFGPILAITSKILLGQKPNQTDYKNVGLGINLLVYKGLSEGKLKGGLVAAFEEGGLVDPQAISAVMEGGDISDWVASSFKEATETNAQKTLREIQQNLRLKQEKEMEPKKGLEQADPNLVPGQPGMSVTGGNADFWALVAIASLESGTPQGRADVAQSIYNRLASGIYGGKTIKELIVSGNGRQYQPVGRAVREFRSISDKESAINAVMIANKLSKMQAEKFINDTASAIQNKELQKSAAEFVGGRTDFWAQGLVPPSNGVGYVVRHGHRFGWFVGPAAIAYGKKNPGPAKAPQLGNIVVMGGGPTTFGAGRVGSVDDFTPMARSFGLSLTSSYRRGDRGYHGKNRARDYSNDAVGKGTPQQLAFAQHLAKNYGSSLRQLIYTPLGYGIAGGKKVGLDYWGPSTNAQHYHHVHVAYEKGGETLDRPHLAMVAEKGKEFVIDADSTKKIQEAYPGLLDSLNKSKNNETIDVLRNFATYEFGADQTVIIQDNQNNVNETSDYEDFSSGGVFMFGNNQVDDPFEFLHFSG